MGTQDYWCGDQWDRLKGFHSPSPRLLLTNNSQNDSFKRFHMNENIWMIFLLKWMSKSFEVKSSSVLVVAWYRTGDKFQFITTKIAQDAIFNSSPPSVAYMRQLTGSALVQIMACRLIGAKPLSEPMLEYC